MDLKQAQQATLTTVKVAFESRPLDKYTLVRNGTLWGKEAYIVTGIEPDIETTNRSGEECFILHSPDKPHGERGVFGWATLECWPNGTYPPASPPAVYADIAAERARQDAKWGTVEQNPHTPEEWFQILKEEFHEVLDQSWAGGPGWREELIHLAAVAAAAVEQYDLQQKAEEAK